MIILFYTLCEETREEHERPMALCCGTGGYERRAGMSLGDKAIIMLNLCHALEAVPCECMLTLSQTHMWFIWMCAHVTFPITFIQKNPQRQSLFILLPTQSFLKFFRRSIFILRCNS